MLFLKNTAFKDIKSLLNKNLEVLIDWRKELTTWAEYHDKEKNLAFGSLLFHLDTALITGVFSGAYLVKPAQLDQNAIIGIVVNGSTKKIEPQFDFCFVQKKITPDMKLKMIFYKKLIMSTINEYNKINEYLYFYDTFKDSDFFSIKTSK